MSFKSVTMMFTKLHTLCHLQRDFYKTEAEGETASISTQVGRDYASIMSGGIDSLNSVQAFMTFWLG